MVMVFNKVIIRKLLEEIIMDVADLLDLSVQGRGREPREGKGQPLRKFQRNDDLEGSMEKEMVDTLKKQNEKLKIKIDIFFFFSMDKQWQRIEVPWVAMISDTRPPKRK